MRNPITAYIERGIYYGSNYVINSGARGEKSPVLVFPLIVYLWPLFVLYERRPKMQEWAKEWVEILCDAASERAARHSQTFMQFEELIDALDEEHYGA